MLNKTCDLENALFHPQVTVTSAAQGSRAENNGAVCVAVVSIAGYNSSDHLALHAIKLGKSEGTGG